MNKFSLYLPDGKRKPFALISPTRNIEPAEFYNIIKTGELQLEQILHIRELSATRELALENKAEISANKEYLAGARMSGTFVGGRDDDNMIAYSYRMVVDIDKQFESLADLKAKIIQDEFVESGFISVSDKGLAVVVRVETKEVPTKELHYEFFYALEDYFHKKFGVEIDKSCKNLSRFRYVSYDPDIYINMDSWGWTERRKSSVFKDKPKTVKQSTTPNLAQPAQQQPTNTNQPGDEELCITRAVNYVQQARDGQKHVHLRDAAHTLGGFVGSGIVNEQLAIDTLYQAILEMNIDDKNKALKTIESGIEKGKLKPIHKVIRPKSDKPEKTRPIPKKADWWCESFNEKGAFRGYDYDMTAYCKWLTENYSIFRYTKSSGAREIVQSNHGVLSIISRDTLHDLLKPYFEQHPETLHTDIILNSTKKREFFDPNYGLTGIPEITESKRTFDFKHRETEYLFFQNCIVSIKASEITLLNYEDFNGLIWDDQVIKRDYEPQPVRTSGEFEIFVNKIAGTEIESFRSALGYMLHSYKAPSTTKAVIIHDQNLTDRANGGTGKSIFAGALRFYKSQCYADGKNVSSQDKFLFENVSEKTQTLFIDDLRRGFSMQLIFNRLTGEWELNKKFQGKVVIPFALSPKIIATTNYTIKKSGSSDERRIFSLEVSNFFNPTNQVSTFFGHDLFNDWVGDLYHEWAKMDEFMMGCISLYLSKGLINQSFTALAEKEFKTEVGEEMIDFLDEFSQSGVLKISTYQEKDQDKITQKNFRKLFVDYLWEQKLPDKYYKNCSAQGLWDRLERWANFRGFEMVEKRSGNNRAFLILNQQIMNQNNTFIEQDLTAGWLDN